MMENTATVHLPQGAPEQGLRRHVPKASISLAAASSVAFITYWKVGATSKIAVLGAISIASFVSSIAGFAFSPICGAMLFHLGPDPVQHCKPSCHELVYAKPDRVEEILSHSSRDQGGGIYDP